MDKKDKNEMQETLDETAKKTKALTTKEYEAFREMSGLGMAKVDPKDIRPPQIILVQKTSDMTNLEAVDGKKPEIGQFYHTGKREIYTSFDCHFVFAAKSKFVNKMKNNELWDQYVSLGVLPDQSLFGMTFRSTALYALSKLFTAAKSQQIPMFAFNVTVEAKKIDGEKGSWFVPTIKVGGLVENPGEFDFLYSLAKDFDAQSESAANNLAPQEEEHGAE